MSLSEQLLRLVQALRRKDTAQDGNFGWPSFQDALADIEKNLTEDNRAAVLEAALNDLSSSTDREIARLREALTSIASSTCCDMCQEAALVAKVALEPENEWSDA